jgi:hypothetical protein
LDHSRACYIYRNTCLSKQRFFAEKLDSIFYYVRLSSLLYSMCINVM